LIDTPFRIFLRAKNTNSLFKKTGIYSLAQIELDEWLELALENSTVRVGLVKPVKIRVGWLTLLTLNG